MKRPHCFVAKEPVLPRVPAGPVLPVAAAPVIPGPVLPVRPGREDLRNLLKRLIGHEVVLQVAGVCRKGRLVSTDPLILCDAHGKSSFVRPDAIEAVEF